MMMSIVDAEDCLIMVKKMFCGKEMKANCTCHQLAPGVDPRDNQGNCKLISQAYPVVGESVLDVSQQKNTPDIHLYIRGNIEGFVSVIQDQAIVWGSF